MKTEEGKHIDYKLTLDLGSEKEKVEVIKELVAFANSGGGKIVFGQDKDSRTGVDASHVDALDSAKCSDQIRKYTGLESFELKHETESLQNGKFIHTLVVPRSQNLIVMSRDGSWKGFDPKKDKPLFGKGDVWVRHSSKTERLSNEDVRQWADGIRADEREKFLSRLNTVISLPEGFDVVAPSGTRIESPKDLLANACSRRQRDPANLLNGDELLWVFQNRAGMTFQEPELSILLASALRRNATLFWWLTLIDDASPMVLAELFNAINGNDRDKSDAARSVLDLAAIYADEKNLRDILKLLRTSRYAHFRSAADSWVSRSSLHASIVSRVKKAEFGKTKLVDLSAIELEKIATQLASDLFVKAENISSNQLGKVNRVIWFKQKGRLVEQV